MTIIDFKQQIERKILKYLLTNTYYLALAEGKLNANYFSECYQKIYLLLLTHYRRYQSVLTENVAKDIFHSDEYRTFTAEDWKILKSLYTANITIEDTHSEFQSSLDLLTSAYRSDSILNLATYIIDHIGTKPDSEQIKELNEYVITRSMELANDNSNIRKSGSIAESADEQLAAYNELHNNPNMIEYIPTGPAN